ncbi:MAG TPA: hypothetical protein VK712_00045 [Verrucomicrobiae bacterium]|nr:hypothetical protein [Verrucomicrobiae bacterium]
MQPSLVKRMVITILFVLILALAMFVLPIGNGYFRLSKPDMGPVITGGCVMSANSMNCPALHSDYSGVCGSGSGSVAWPDSAVRLVNYGLPFSYYTTTHPNKGQICPFGDYDDAPYPINRAAFVIDVLCYVGLVVLGEVLLRKAASRGNQHEKN